MLPYASMFVGIFAAAVRPISAVTVELILLQ